MRKIYACVRRPQQCACVRVPGNPFFVRGREINVPVFRRRRSRPYAQPTRSVNVIVATKPRARAPAVPCPTPHIVVRHCKTSAVVVTLGSRPLPVIEPTRRSSARVPRRRSSARSPRCHWPFIASVTLAVHHSPLGQAGHLRHVDRSADQRDPIANRVASIPLIMARSVSKIVTLIVFFVVMTCSPALVSGRHDKSGEKRLSVI